MRAIVPPTRERMTVNTDRMKVLQMAAIPVARSLRAVLCQVLQYWIIVRSSLGILIRRSGCPQGCPECPCSRRTNRRRPWDLADETRLKLACTYTVVRTSRRHAKASVRSAGRGDSLMRRPLVTIRDAYPDQQGRSHHGRARDEDTVWMHARGVFVCLGAGRMRRGHRVRFIPDGTTFQE